MRLRLLIAEMIDTVLSALSRKTQSQLVAEDDARRIAMLGSDEEIHAQALRAQSFGEEVAAKL